MAKAGSKWKQQPWCRLWQQRWRSDVWQQSVITNACDVTMTEPGFVEWKAPEMVQMLLIVCDWLTGLTLLKIAVTRRMWKRWLWSWPFFFQNFMTPYCKPHSYALIQKNKSKAGNTLTKVMCGWAGSMMKQDSQEFRQWPLKNKHPLIRKIEVLWSNQQIEGPTNQRN